MKSAKPKERSRKEPVAGRQSPRPLDLTFHIGAHKTGSTAIQVAAEQKVAHLLSHGIHYPVGLFANFPNQHSEIAFALRAGQTQSVGQALRKAARDARRKGANQVFLSGEELYDLNAKEVETLTAISCKIFRNVRVCLLLRNREDYLISKYKHFLRYGQREKENFFLEKIQDPESVIKAWKRNINGKFIVLNYDSIKENLVREFFSRTFACDISINDRHNYSLDMLTLQVFDVFFKDFLHLDVDRLMWNFLLTAGPAPRFPVEDVIRKEIATHMPSRGWDPIELEPGILLRPSDDIAAIYDPIAVCDRMATLFRIARDHFAQQMADADADVAEEEPSRAQLGGAGI